MTESIDNENNSLFKREVFEVVDLPPGQKALKSKYILKLKRLSEGRMKFKARLVALCVINAKASTTVRQLRL
jgi:hypothetical protein